MRPIHKWKTLSLGIIVLIFLGWAWARSMHRLDSLLAKSGNTSLSVQLTASCISISRHTLATPAGRLPAFSFNSDESDAPHQRWFPPAIAYDDHVDGLAAYIGEIKTGGGEQQPPRSFDRSDLVQLIKDAGLHPNWKLAYWFLILLFLIPWLALLTWRWRKMNRLPIPPPPAPAPPPPPEEG